jgi:DNA-binding Lrp family transcriptional regulator
MTEHAEHNMHHNSLATYWQEREKLSKRSNAIMAVYCSTGCQMTDREVLAKLPFSDMNSVRPRITELIQDEYLIEKHSTIDKVTGKMVRACTYNLEKLL